MNRTELLKGIPLFDGLNAQELEEISELFREAFLLKGDTICRRGGRRQSIHRPVGGVGGLGRKRRREASSESDGTRGFLRGNLASYRRNANGNGYRIQRCPLIDR